MQRTAIETDGPDSIPCRFVVEQDISLLESVAVSGKSPGKGCPGRQFFCKSPHEFGAVYIEAFGEDKDVFEIVRGKAYRQFNPCFVAVICGGDLNHGACNPGCRKRNGSDNQRIIKNLCPNNLTGSGAPENTCIRICRSDHIGEAFLLNPIGCAEKDNNICARTEISL